jgi:hypothetical protein
VKTQIWIAVSVYVLVAIIRKRLMLPISLYQILQILSVTLFEKTPILQALQPSGSQEDFFDSSNQLNLFTLYPDTSDIVLSLIHIRTRPAVGNSDYPDLSDSYAGDPMLARISHHQNNSPEAVWKGRKSGLKKHVFSMSLVLSS